MPESIDAFVQGNALINLNGALTQLFYLFQTKNNKALASIDPLTVMYYCGVVSCRRADVVLSGAQHVAITKALRSCIDFAHKPDAEIPNKIRREQIAIELAHALGDYVYETKRPDAAIVDRST